MVKRHLAGLTVAALIVGGGAAAWAAAPSPSGPATAPAPAPAQGNRPKGPRDGGGGAGGLLRRVVHGDLVVRAKGGTFENMTVDKGTVASKGDNTFTLNRPDGKTVTLKVDGSTKYKGVNDFAGLQTGQPAVVLSHDGLAVTVGQRQKGGNSPTAANVEP